MGNVGREPINSHWIGRQLRAGPALAYGAMTGVAANPHESALTFFRITGWRAVLSLGVTGEQNKHCNNNLVHVNLCTVAAVYEGVNELQDRVFPSSERRGGCAIKKMLRSLLMKAQTGWSVPDNVSRSTSTIMTTPSAPLRRLRAFFLLAQPPLLFQEGNTLSWHFIHTFHRAPLQ
ncbi:MAG: hypothetical protein DMG11_35195 [Acidobacteria bacterium]|nr:MAG: hypothetical protein DMG11_35195 [Acidobacteriota bacterium]